MSLRDALLKAGAVSNKKVAEVNRQLKDERKHAQAQREKKTLSEARAEQERREAAEHRLRELAEARRQREALHGAEAARLRTRELIRSHRLRFADGPARFWHPAVDGVGLLRLDLPWPLARELRAGRLAVAVLEPSWGGEPEYHLLPRGIADRIAEQDPRAVVFCNPTVPDPDDPTLRLLDEDVARTPPRWLAPPTPEPRHG